MRMRPNSYRLYRAVYAVIAIYPEPVPGVSIQKLKAYGDQVRVGTHAHRPRVLRNIQQCNIGAPDGNGICQDWAGHAGEGPEVEVAADLDVLCCVYCRSLQVGGCHDNCQLWTAVGRQLGHGCRCHAEVGERWRGCWSCRGVGQGLWDRGRARLGGDVGKLVMRSAAGCSGKLFLIVHREAACIAGRCE